MAKNTIDFLVTELGKALSPLRSALLSPEDARLLLNELGWDLPPGINDIGLAAIKVQTVIDRLRDVVHSTPEERKDDLLMAERYAKLLTAVTDLIKSIRSAMEALSTLPGLPADYLNKTRIHEKLAIKLLDFLIITYVKQNYYSLYCLLEFVGIFEIKYKSAESIYHVERLDHSIMYDRIGKVFSDPGGLPAEVYGWGTSGMDAEALLFNFARLLQSFGAEVRPRLLPRRVEEKLLSRSVPEAETDPMPQLVISMLKGLGWDPLDVGLAAFGLRPTSPAGVDGGIGVFPFIKGTSNFIFPLSPEGKWNFEIKCTLDLQGGVVLLIRPDQPISLQSGLIRGGSGGAVIAGKLAVGLRYSSGENERTRLLSISGGTGLEVGQFSITGEASIDPSAQDYGFLLEVGSAAIIVSAGDGDGFLQKVLPKDGMRIDFDIALGWSNKKGIYFRGSAGLEMILPLHKSLLGVLTVESIYLAIQSKGTDISTVLAATARVELGPIKAVVDRMGLEAIITFPKSGGNLGPANLDLTFKPPDGAGLAIDATAVVGGGYLFFDPKNEQYAGILQLEVKGGISLKAIGLLTTRMPDGSKGSSLIIIITAEGLNFQLGFGVVLDGVGGLVGVNRTMVVEVLIAGIKNHTLDSILFPKNPVANAQQIISDLRSVFPPVTNQYVFGPMAKLGWGTPRVLTVELGILLEFPSPIRLVILGKLRLVLPKEEAALIILQMDVIGYIDFDKSDALVLATLYDSRVVQFVISGMMATRVNWGATPVFILAAGGFNPRFQAPSDLPALDRLAISLATGDNPRLRLEAYFAQTSNTVQFGARLDLYAAIDVFLVGKLSIEGYLGFDALFQFPPFYMAVDIYAGVALKHNGNVVFAVMLDMHLTGPEPWHAWGIASFELLGKHSIPFDHTFGEEGVPPALPESNPKNELLDELKDIHNWSALLPEGEHMLVTLRKLQPSTDVLVHPLGYFTAQQRKMPLNMTISKYGNTTIVGENRFEITKVELNKTAVQKINYVKCPFAPAQFSEMSDDEKLSQPSFVEMDCGIRFGTAEILCPQPLVVEFDYEDVVVDIEPQTKIKKFQHVGRYMMSEDVLLAHTLSGAVARSAMKNTGADKYAGEDIGIDIEEQTYGVVSTDDMTVPEELRTKAKGGLRYTEAQEAKEKYIAKNPEATGKIQIVSRHEMAEA